MSERLKVLFLPLPDLFERWGNDLVSAVTKNHDLRIADYDQPLAPQFEDIDAVIDHGGSVGTREMVDLAAAGKVRHWQVLGTGFDHFDLEYWKAKGMPVSNCPGAFSAVALADCAMMFILMLARRYQESKEILAGGELYRPIGAEMEGWKLGILGLGASGIELAKRAPGFGMKTLAIDIRDIGPDEVSELGLEFAGKPADMDDVIAQSDVVSLHLHLNQETRHIIDSRRLKLMKSTAFLVNVSRGELVDEAALETALVEGWIGGAGIDVYSQEPPDLSSAIFRLPNAVTTPHIAGVTDGTSRKRAGCAAENLDRLAAGLEPLYRIDQ